MAANPPGSCCYKGVTHEGNATGEYSKLNDFEIYTKHPEDKGSENGVLILTDVIGHRFINAQLIADQFAANGYFVMMPDLFFEDPIQINRPADFDIQKWMKGGYNSEGKSHLPETVDAVVEACVKEMRSKYGCKKIGAVGYCFGAKYVVRFLKPGQVDAGYSAHPSFVTMEELTAIEGPYSIAAAQTDQIFTDELRHKSEEVLKKSNQPWQINLYSGVEHGFAVRGDPNKPVAKFAKESAFLQALRWFEEHLSINQGGSRPTSPKARM